MSSNDLEGNTSALAETYAAAVGTARVVFESPVDIFPQGIEKEYCNSGL
jgi:hypothetical protein